MSQAHPNTEAAEAAGETRVVLVGEDASTMSRRASATQEKLTCASNCWCNDQIVSRKFGKLMSGTASSSTVVL
jgi:hypothetical protein